jgi:hypothetical protein
MSIHVTDASIYDVNAKAMVASGLYAELNPASPSWEDWRTYFRFISHRLMLTCMDAHECRTWIGKGGLMVPAEWPRDFDPRAPKAMPRPVASKPVEADAYRAEVVRRLLNNWKRHP